MKSLLTLTLLAFISFSSFAQDEDETSPILFIYDASGSMWAAMEGKTRVEIARDVLATSISNLPETQQIGLIAYGHRQKGDCEDVEYLVDLSNTDKSQVTGEIQQIKPLGMTPLAYSANLAIDDLKKSNQKATIILVTDGIESCDGNICEVITQARSAGIDFKLHIIGFGLKEDETEQLKCAAAAGDGQYFDAKDSAGLLGSLEEATTATVDMPAGNYGLFVKLNGQLIDALVQVLDPDTKKKVSLKRTYGDSVLISLPEGTSDLEVTALENTDLKPIRISGVSADPNQIVYKEISFDGGKMALTITNNGKPWDTAIRIFEAESKKPVTAGRSYGDVKEFELNPGFYDVELLALVISGEKTVQKEKIEIKAGEKSELLHDYKTGTAIIGALNGSELLDATVFIKTANTKENVAGMRTYTSASSNPREFILTPGEYEVTVTAVTKEFAGKKEVFVMKIIAGERFEKTINF